jgi:hypothetical protein
MKCGDPEAATLFSLSAFSNLSIDDVIKQSSND